MTAGNEGQGTPKLEGGRKATVDRILQEEWAQFQAVNNVGGPASCQSMPNTFALMRSVQFSAWTDAMVASYEDDLFQAKAAGRNLMTEKYGYMMEETDPEYYHRVLEPRFPKTSEEARGIIEESLAQNRAWEQEVHERYPFVAARARRAEGASGGGLASVDVYARGELRTYSLRTLRLYRELVRDAVGEGRNLALEERAAIARGYGCKTLEELESKLAASDAARER